tara:strand:+ start:692 stop:2107 length:1416 start_codon:yes stop_codon:yes gene_type:complete
MRFGEIKNFSIDDLLLDEGNYRFRKAPDQNACIEKIYRSNSQYFSNLMTSIAEDDLGEPLLVFLRDGESIVLDGNRRTAAIKVLRDPELAPTSALKKKAETLLKKTSFDFEHIQAQVSSSKEAIYKTVYERHASSNGSRRLSWSAIAAARFRLDQNILEENGDWHATALIFELENRDSELSDFIDSKGYSHEVFTRIVRAAIKRGIIPKSVFNERDMRIKKNPRKTIKDALEKAKIFLESIKNKELSLSRKENGYADASKIDDYLSQFECTEVDSHNAVEDKADVDGEGEYTEWGDSASNDRSGDYEHKDEVEFDIEHDEGPSSENYESRNYRRITNTIIKSEKIEKALHKLGSQKLDQLYTSLCSIALRPHASLMCVGAWTFLESLASLSGKSANIAFEGFYTSKINEWYSDKGEKAELRRSVKYIADEGNVIKHGSFIHSPDARHLSQHFSILEPVFLKMIEIALKKQD